MPIYEYRGHTFEVMQRMSEDPLTSCATCDAPVQRVFHPVAVHFKGSGFYTTDYAKKKTAGASDSSSKGEDKKSDNKESRPTESFKKADSS